MLPPSVKEGIKKAAGAIASGKMKPGDSMIMRPKDDEPMEDDESTEDNSGFMSMAEDMMKAFDAKDTKGLANLLEELCEHSKEY